MENQDNKEEAATAKPFLLRPSALGSSAGGFGSSLQDNKPLLLRPSKLSAIADQIDTSSDTKKRKADKEPAEDEVEKDSEGAAKKSKSDEISRCKSPSLQLNEQLIKPQGIGTFGFGKQAEVNDDKTLNSNKSSDDGTSTSSSIFGQNIHDKVVGFQEIKKQVQPSPEEDTTTNDKPSSSAEEHEKKLAENAIEHMKQEESSKLHLKEVEQVTGEEGERNVIQVQCKLHLFNKEKTSWIEKGRGTLKLNDICQSEVDGVFQSRIVFRTNGSQLVVLNTLLWPEMCYEKASAKSLRFTAIHPETKQIKVYLITSAPKEILQFYTAIDQRILALKRNQEAKLTDESDEDSQYSARYEPQGDDVETCKTNTPTEKSGEDKEEGNVSRESEADNSKDCDSEKSNESVESDT